jgi:hypothetical protein
VNFKRRKKGLKMKKKEKKRRKTVEKSKKEKFDRLVKKANLIW